MSASIKIPAKGKERDDLAWQIGQEIEKAIGHDWLDDMTAYGVASMVIALLLGEEIEAMQE